jgi:hypothetical protein
MNFYLPYLRVIFDHNAEMAAHLALGFRFFDITPGKRQTRIVWNGEIDHLSKRKDVNREIKKIVRTLYPTVERVIKRDVDPVLLQQIANQLKTSKTDPEIQQSKKKTAKTESTDHSEKHQDVKKPGSPKIPRKKKKSAKKKEKPLTDFF